MVTEARNAEAEKLWPTLIRLHRHLPARRRRGFSQVFGLSIISAFAEIVTLGAVLPFLTLITDRNRVSDSSIAQGVVRGIAKIDSENIMFGVLILVVVAALVAGFIQVTLAWASHHLAFGTAHDLTMKIMETNLYLPFEHRIAQNSSELVAEVNKVQYLTMRTLVPLLHATTNSVSIVLIFLALVFIHPQIALGAGAILASAYVALAVAARRILRRNSAIISSTQASRMQVVQESAGAYREIILDQSQSYFLHRFGELDRRFRKAQVRNSVIASVPKFIIQTVSIIAIIGLAFFYSRQEGGLSSVIPTLGVLALGIQRLLPALQGVFASWTQLKGGQQVVIDMLKMLDLRNDPPISNTRECALLSFDSTVELRGVTFSHAEAGASILTKANLIIEKGEKIGLVGVTGSGKSTVADIILGLLHPTSGKLLVDGKEVGPENTRRWQKYVGHVAQDLYLIDASLAQNIAFCLDPKKIDWQWTEEVVEKAQLSDFVATLPDGLNTIVGERGVRLSGGQRQRIGIARAFYKRAELLVFDEATSALDDLTESRVMQFIQSLDRNVTTIFISHRRKSIDWCDRIYQIENGQLQQL